MSEYPCHRLRVSLALDGTRQLLILEVENDMRGPRTIGRQIVAVERIINIHIQILLASECCVHKQGAFQLSAAV